ncbi:flagellar hook-length control protein [Acidovorax sp. KKS102]|nr:flagellar hook-length control protein [Acidovorax sp. KKS102]
MGPTKVASSQGTQPAHTARAKSSSHSETVEAGKLAVGGGFFALLATFEGATDGLGENTQGDNVIDNPSPALENATDVVSTPSMDASAVGAWLGLFSSLRLPNTTASAWQYSIAPPQNTEGSSTVNRQTLLHSPRPVGLSLGGTVAVAQSGPQGLAASSVSALSEPLGSAASAWQYSIAPSQNTEGSSTVNRQMLLHPSPPVGLSLGGAVAVAQSDSQGLIASLGSGLGEKLFEGIPQGLSAETAKLDASTDLEPIHGASAGFGRAFSRTQSGSPQRVSGMGGSDASLGSAAFRDSAVRPTSVHGFSSALLSSTGERTLIGGVAGGTVDRSSVTQSVPVIGVESAAPLADSLVAMVGSAQAAESPADVRSHRNGEGAGTTGAWSEGVSGPSPSDAGGFTDATALADPNALGAEEQVAEQVAYWVNQKTQNAELTLQRDGHPVEVSVSLSGNEAHVSFRSDQQHTRELLDQSMAQLSDLLRSEGLVLSGMSVGTSAHGSEGGGETGQQRPREGARQAQVVSAVPAGTTSLARGGGALDRAVDIFV